MIEEPAFYPWLTGRQNLHVIAWEGGGCPVTELSRVLDATGLSDVAGRKVRAYSQGMRQRLGLAAAMLGRPATADHRRADQWTRPRGHPAGSRPAW
jgi:ABC-type multidrug transport system ATPase subunit